MTCHTRKYIEAERPEGAWLWLGTHFHVLAAASPSLRAPLRKLAIVRARFRGVQKRHTSRVKIFCGGVLGGSPHSESGNLVSGVGSLSRQQYGSLLSDQGRELQQEGLRL